MACKPPPFRVKGNRPPSRQSQLAPISPKGFSTRFIGRPRRDASPVKVALKPNPAAAPMISRTPVPALPQSMTSAGSANTPRPTTRQAPSPRRSTSAPKARMAPAERLTSSPSSKPSTCVSPRASAPRMSARCEIDLSPGARTDPLSGCARLAVMSAAVIFEERASRPLAISRGVLLLTAAPLRGK